MVNRSLRAIAGRVSVGRGQAVRESRAAWRWPAPASRPSRRYRPACRPSPAAGWRPAARTGVPARCRVTTSTPPAAEAAASDLIRVRREIGADHRPVAAGAGSSEAGTPGCGTRPRGRPGLCRFPAATSRRGCLASLMALPSRAWVWWWPGLPGLPGRACGGSSVRLVGAGVDQWVGDEVYAWHPVDDRPVGAVIGPANGGGDVARRRPVVGRRAPLPVTWLGMW